MDHIIDIIWEYSESDRSELAAEWNSGKYSKLNECPSYPLVKAYCDSINALNKVYQLDVERLTPKRAIERGR